MGINKTKQDFELIDKVLDDYAEKDKTDIKCPYCGNDMLKEVYGNSYRVTCRTKDCLSEEFRGL